MQAKTWQIVLMVLAVLAMCTSVLYTCSQTPNTESMKSIYLVDVSTGEIFEADLPKGRPMMFPAVHPDTQVGCLYPAVTVDGKWFVGSRYLGFALQPREGEKKADLKGLADVKTGEIIPAPGSPKKANVFK